MISIGGNDVTHDQEEAMAVFDRNIVMKNAQIAQMGTPGDLYNAPNSEFIADFIGDANVLDCEVFSVKAGVASIEVDGAKLKVPTDEKASFNASLVFRPQNATLSSICKKASLKGNVTYAAFLGNQIQYTINTASGDMFVVDNLMNKHFQIGSDVHLLLNEKKLALVPK